MTRSENSNTANRLEAFSDGVFAIIITIMVLGLRPPSGHKFSDLVQLRPVFLSYLLSFISLMIYWNNHHHLLKTMHSANGWTMWANAHLLFWLSLVPFTTAWVGQSRGAKAPAVLYGISLLMAGIAYWILQTAIIGTHGHDSTLKEAIGRNFKGKLSPTLYIIAIIFAFVAPLISYILYAAVALMWIIPDRRIAQEI